MSRKRWLALIAFAMLFVASIAINAATSSLFSADSILKDEQWDEKIIAEGEDMSGSIAVLEVNGIIENVDGFFNDYNHESLLAQLDYAAENPFVKGIILRVNTPGGGVVESAEIYDKVIHAQRTYDKPVFVSMGSMAASGGYYIAAPADKIVASPQTITGSIGVIMESINVTELAEKYGVKVNTLTSGPYKDIMSSTREMTEGDRAILQSLIDESYDEFVRIIAEGRNMSEEEVRKVADGRIYSGNQAYSLNLIDELGDLDDTIQLMKEHVGADYNVVEYDSTVSFSKLFSMSLQQLFVRDHELAKVEQILSKYRTPTLKYLYAQ